MLFLLLQTISDAVWKNLTDNTDFVHTRHQVGLFRSNFSIFFFSTDLQSDSWQTVSCPIILFDARSRGQARVVVAARAHMHANTCTRNFILGWLPLIAADFPNSTVCRSLSHSLSLNICVWSESCINYSPAAAPCLRLSPVFSLASSDSFR